MLDLENYNLTGCPFDAKQSVQPGKFVNEEFTRKLT